VNLLYTARKPQRTPLRRLPWSCLPEARSSPKRKLPWHSDRRSYLPTQHLKTTRILTQEWILCSKSKSKVSVRIQWMITLVWGSLQRVSLNQETEDDAW